MTRLPAVLAPYVPTPHEVVARMLQLAEVAPGDLVYDLGCGDGRICIAAARDHGARAVGIDIEPYWVDQARAGARSAGVEELTTFQVADASNFDVTKATVIMLYLVEWSVQTMARTVLPRAQSGARIISHSFGIQGCEPHRQELVVDASGKKHNIYCWIAGQAGDLQARPNERSTNFPGNELYEVK